jgi:antitoxin ParD1/3/4
LPYKFIYQLAQKSGANVVHFIFLSTAIRCWHIMPILWRTAMVTRNVVLTTQQADLVERLVSSGRFQNASEALRAGLRLLEQDEYEVIELRERLMVSLRQAKQSQFADGDGKDVVRRAFSSARTGQV